MMKLLEVIDGMGKYGIFNKDNSIKKIIKSFVKGNTNLYLSEYNRYMTGVFNKSDLEFLTPKVKESVVNRNLWYFKKHYLSKEKDVIKRTQYIDTHSFCQIMH